MDQVTKTPCWVRGSMIKEIAWIGKDTLAWCTGLYIVFFHTVKRRQMLRWCWDHATGDGAHRISGHMSSSIFAFSERSLNPRIFVLAYPSMTTICQCVQGCASGYLSIAFTARDHLVSLGSYPSFPMIVWCWRTGEKIVTVDTFMRDEIGQTIKITPMGRTVISQVGNTCGRLFTWEVDIVNKLVILKDHEVKLPNDEAIHDVDWYPDQGEPLLAITDKHGHIYLSDYDGTDVRRIVTSQRCGICLDMELPAIRWFRGGIILRTTFCQIRYFVKDRKLNVWRKQWYLKSISKPYILVSHPFKNHWLFYYTLEGYLVQIIFSENEKSVPSIHRHLLIGGRYRFVDFLRPWCHHLAVTDDLKELSILESYGGVEVAKVDLEMEGVVTDQASHPDKPLIVSVSDQGEMVIVGVADPAQPTILARFHLQKKLLDIVRFSYSGSGILEDAFDISFFAYCTFRDTRLSGRFLVTAQKKTGNCYCVNLQLDQPWNVMGQLRTRRLIIDVALCDKDDTDDSLKLLVLFVKYERFSVGQELLVYDVSRANKYHLIDITNYTIISLPGLYRELRHAPGNNPWMLIGSPYLTRQLNALKIQESKDTTLVGVEITGHHVRLARVFTDLNRTVTCAYDGLVVVRGKNIHEILTVISAHHRLDSGTQKAVISTAGDRIVALGHDGSLVSLLIRSVHKKESEASTIETESVYPIDHEWYEKQKEEILADYASLDSATRSLFSKVREDCPEKYENKSWEAWRQDMQFQEEAKLYAAEKAAIIKDLTALRDIIRQLLDVNEICPEKERLPISAFDVDRAGRDYKLKAAKDEREDVRMELEHYHTSADRIAGWIKKTFWDPQIVLSRSIFSFRGDIEVTNYPLFQEEPFLKDRLQWAQFTREILRNIIYGDTFQPWRSYTSDQLRTELNKPNKVQREEERYKMVLLEEEEREIDPEELKELRAFDGMSTHRFVEQSPYYYAQIESYGFIQITRNEHYLMQDCIKLRVYFNKLFDDIFAAKEREISMINEKNERIRHIDFELRTMFGQSLPHIPVDPRWHPKEKIENIIQVHEHEVKAKPFVSSSEQSALNRLAAEAERERKLLLADDFRERALMKMMDGVLEIRWEDTIKIDVRKPECMLEKQPEHYTQVDIIAVKKYEASVEVLRQERERYRRMLEADYVKVSTQLQEGIDRFDAKLNEFFQQKLRVDVAINQLKLRHFRGRACNLARIEALKEDDRVKREISEWRQRSAMLEEHARKLYGVYQEMLAQHDAFCTREKGMVRKLQQEFASLSKVSFELFEREYKRRPKVSLKNVPASDLVNLGRYLVNRTKPAYLPSDCKDYAKSLENLDVPPDNLPRSVDASYWDHLVQLRRQKVEMEMKIRAHQLEMNSAEQTMATFESKVDACKSNVDHLSNELKRMIDKRVTYEQNTELQLMLKRGQVEMVLHGERCDTVNAVMVPRSEIEHLNEHISAAGARKLNALKRTIDFRHGTLSTEWEHRCLKTRFKELEEDLRFLRDITVTRDIRMYLKRRAKGLRDDKTMARLKREIETARKTLERTYSKEANKLENVRSRIVSVSKENAKLDQSIAELNMARWKLEHSRDFVSETRQQEHEDRKMRLFTQRSDLIRKIQDNYTELLALQTEYELLRLRTYPTLETLDDKSET